MGSVLKLDALRDAAQSLREAITLVQNEEWFSAQSPGHQRLLIAGVIQNFEFVHELCAKMIKRRLDADAVDPAETDYANYRDILRLAGEKGLIENVEAWFAYRDLRNATSHTYNAQRAMTVYKGIPDFLTAAEKLLQKLDAHNG